MQNQYIRFISFNANFYSYWLGEAHFIAVINRYDREK